MYNNRNNGHYCLLNNNGCENKQTYNDEYINEVRGIDENMDYYGQYDMIDSQGEYKKFDGSDDDFSNSLNQIKYEYNDDDSSNMRSKSIQDIYNSLENDKLINYDNKINKTDINKCKNNTDNIDNNINTDNINKTNNVKRTEHYNNINNNNHSNNNIHNHKQHRIKNTDDMYKSLNDLRIWVTGLVIGLIFIILVDLISKLSKKYNN